MPITIGRSIIQPSYVAVADDMVTYGGAPQCEKPKEGDVLLINTERLEGRTTYETVVRQDMSTYTMAWPGVTTPGESGSPVFVKRDEKLYLVALAGRWVQSGMADTTEYARVYTRESQQATEFYQRIIMAPGSGKTWRVMPEMVSKMMVEKQGRILVTGPTRVVCREIHKALLEKGIECGLNIKGEPSKVRPRARVQIAAHNTMLQMLLNSDPIVARP
jgi:hypothetical protein